MVKKVRIRTDKVRMEAELNDSKTAGMIYNALPIEGKVNTWGEEIYFSIPVKTKIENGVAVVKEGDLGYWPPQNCFCIFFGQTPSSTTTEIRPASAVSLLGRMSGNPKDWKKVADGEKILIEKI